MSDHTETGTTAEHGPATTRRVIFTDTRWWAADIDIETADILLAEHADICDVSDELVRLRRTAPHHYPVEADLTVEAAEDSGLSIDDHGVIDGTKPESYYWSARWAVMEARHHLMCGRYREGDCREMDTVNAKLTAIEDELRLLAMAVDSGRAEMTATSDASGSSREDAS